MYNRRRGLDAVLRYIKVRWVFIGCWQGHNVVRVSDSLISSSVECRQRYLIRLIALHDMSAVERGVYRARGDCRELVVHWTPISTDNLH